MSYAEDDEEIIAPNTTLDGLLRKLEDGDFINHAGGEAQQLLIKLREIAGKRGNAKGEIRVTLKISMGRDGYALTVGSIECKAPKAAARPESTIYVDQDGDINGKPVPKQVTLQEVVRRQNETKNPTAPAVKGL
jgi:hypothetical protein